MRLRRAGRGLTVAASSEATTDADDYTDYAWDSGGTSYSGTGGLAGAGGPGGALLAGGVAATGLGVLLLAISGRRSARARSARRTR